MRFLTTLALLVAILLTGLLAGCGQDNKTASPGDEAAVLTIGTLMKIDGINVRDDHFSLFRKILSHKGLVKLDEGGRFTGDLAKSWQTADGQTWTFELHDNITWHDGLPVTADDIKFTIEYSINHFPEDRAHYSLIKSVTVPDAKTLVITLSQPNPRFLVNVLPMRTLPQHIFAAVDDPSTFNDPQAAIGCGPYRFENFDAGAGLITFKANTDYYRGTPLIPKIRVRLFQNPDALYMALQSGQIDLPYYYSGGTDAIYANSIAKNPKIKLMSIPNLGVNKALLFNVTKPVVNDREVRTALSYAIDYNELIRLFAPRTGLPPTAGFVPQGTPGFAATRQLEFNPEKAKALLDQAGYVPGSSGIREKDGQLLVFELMLRNDIPENIRMSELVQKYFANIGVKMTLNIVDLNLFRTISDKDRSHTSLLARTTPWGMMMWGGQGSGYFDARYFGWAMVDDAEFTAIVDNMNAELDPEAYKQHSAELQQYYADNLPAIALYWDSFIQPYNAAWTGWKLSPIYGILNEETWFSLQKTGP